MGAQDEYIFVCSFRLLGPESLPNLELTGEPATFFTIFCRCRSTLVPTLSVCWEGRTGLANAPSCWAALPFLGSSHTKFAGNWTQHSLWWVCDHMTVMWHLLCLLDQGDIFGGVWEMAHFLVHHGNCTGGRGQFLLDRISAAALAFRSNHVNSKAVTCVVAATVWYQAILSIESVANAVALPRTRTFEGRGEETKSPQASWGTVCHILAHTHVVGIYSRIPVN